METKHSRIELKATPDGSFVGLLSPYNVTDQGGDMVEKGAYSKNLRDQGNTRPMLWQHQSDQPIGTLELEDRADGLYAKGKILLDVPAGKTAYALIKAGVVKGLSIGYQTIREDVQNGIRHLKELKLYEGSIVTFPMAESALITSVKSSKEFDAFKDSFANALVEFKTDVLKSLTTSSKGRH